MRESIQPIPNRFIYEEGGFGISSKLELIKGTFYNTPKFEQTALKLGQPSMEKWISFRYFLDHLNAWKWNPNYSNCSILDGTQWSLEIEYGDSKISCSGSNSYPAFLDADYEENGKVSLDWRLFHASLNWLTNR